MVKGHVTFDLHVLLKNFIIMRNFFILRDRVFIFGICVPYDKNLRQIHKFWTCDLDRDRWPTFDNF